MGGRCCKEITGRRNWQDQREGFRGCEPDAPLLPSLPVLSGHAAAQPALSPLATPEAVEWVNDILARLWQNIDKAAQKIADEQVIPDLQSKMPWPLKVHFERFTLGGALPVLGPIKVYPNATPRSMKVMITVNYHSDLDIAVSVGIASIGIRSLKLSGEVTFELQPLLDEVPVVGGAMAYFLDPPRIDLTFTGIGAIAELPLLHSLVRNEVNAQVAATCVLPNVSAIPIGTKEQGVEPRFLKRPNPLGVLRVTILSGTGLQELNPYVKLRLAHQEWDSRQISGSGLALWGQPEDSHDFLVFAEEQKLWIEVFNSVIILGDDLICQATPLKVPEALASSTHPITLHNLGGHKGEKRRASLLLRIEWLNFAPKDLGNDNRLSDDHRCIVVVKVDSIFLPRACGDEAAVGAKFRNSQKRTPFAQKDNSKKNEAVVKKAFQCVIASCKAKGIAEDVIAEIASLEAEDVAEANAEVEIATSLFFPTSCASLHTEELTLSVVDRRQELATTNVQLSHLLASTDLSLPGPVKLSTSKGEDIEAQIEVSVWGLSSNVPQ